VEGRAKERSEQEGSLKDHSRLVMLEQVVRDVGVNEWRKKK